MIEQIQYLLLKLLDMVFYDNPNVRGFDMMFFLLLLFTVMYVDNIW